MATRDYPRLRIAQIKRDLPTVRTAGMPRLAASMEKELAQIVGLLNAPRCSGCGKPHPETDSDNYSRCCGKSVWIRRKASDGTPDPNDEGYNELLDRWPLDSRTV
jgi:hypothetical protein